jgi:Ca2+-binding EF-hand superfamily protein
MFLTIFGERIQGADPEDVIIKAFKTFDMHEVGKVEEAPLRKLLVNVGDKLEEEEVEQALGDAPIDENGWLDYHAFCRLICRGKEDEGEAAA